LVANIIADSALGSPGSNHSVGRLWAVGIPSRPSRAVKVVGKAATNAKGKNILDTAMKQTCSHAIESQTRWRKQKRANMSNLIGQDVVDISARGRHGAAV